MLSVRNVYSYLGKFIRPWNKSNDVFLGLSSKVIMFSCPSHTQVEDLNFGVESYFQEALFHMVLFTGNTIHGNTNH